MRSRPSGNFKSFPHGDEGVGFGDQHLSQHSAGTFACKFRQWIVDVVRLTEGNDSGISRHGVSLVGLDCLGQQRSRAVAQHRGQRISKVPGWESWKTLASVTAYHSFGGKWELRTPHDTTPYLLMPSPTSAHSSLCGKGTARDELEEVWQT